MQFRMSETASLKSAPTQLTCVVTEHRVGTWIELCKLRSQTKAFDDIRRHNSHMTLVNQQLSFAELSRRSRHMEERNLHKYIKILIRPQACLRAQQQHDTGNTNSSRMPNWVGVVATWKGETYTSTLYEANHQYGCVVASSVADGRSNHKLYCYSEMNR